MTDGRTDGRTDGGVSISPVPGPTAAVRSLLPTQKKFHCREHKNSVYTMEINNEEAFN